MALLKVDNITAGYGEETVINDLSFHVNQGEIVSLLGPSGCGKTTALRAVGGFEEIRSGEIQINKRPVSAKGLHTPPEKRAIGMVFQDYALFPHMDVSDNIAFGLKDLNRQEKQKQVDHLLEATGLSDFAKRYPHELSGGQQQRVALARALAPHPSLLLMDEPFSNLDIELRERLNLEVRDILKREGITGILVTHDQDEAFAISDKVGVMYGGKILQWDTPYNLYHEPGNRFVADFIGQGRFLKGIVSSPETFETELGELTANRSCTQSIGREIDILIRPDDLIPDENGPISATVQEKAFKGAQILYTLRLGSGTDMLSLFPSHHDHAIGEQVKIRLDAEHLICFPHQG